MARMGTEMEGTEVQTDKAQRAEALQMTTEMRVQFFYMGVVPVLYVYACIMYVRCEHA